MKKKEKAKAMTISGGEGQGTSLSEAILPRGSVHSPSSSTPTVKNTPVISDDHSLIRSLSSFPPFPLQTQPINQPHTQNLTCPCHIRPRVDRVRAILTVEPYRTRIDASCTNPRPIRVGNRFGLQIAAPELHSLIGTRDDAYYVKTGYGTIHLKEGKETMTTAKNQWVKDIWCTHKVQMSLWKFLNDVIPTKDYH